eukprot:Pompholyxophrys_punicea_v1_NODE_44_length_4495_cov_238.718243.p2 type:complete len:361 gc:universal NODE_44_length_4495_cov_238.718243:2878-3960(+)
MDKEQIIELYKDPEVGLRGLDQFMVKLKERGVKLKKDEVKKILSEMESYSLNRPIVKKPPKSRKIVAFDVFEQLQADLVFMDVPQGAPASDNDGVKYLITVIDVMSKYAWVKPLKDKRGESITVALEPIIKEAHPKLLQVDMGSEFYNQVFQKMLKKYDVKMYSSHSDHKAAVVERFNRTLKGLMSRLFDARQTFRYIDVLDKLVKNYNTSRHSTIKMKPVDAIKGANFPDVYENFHAANIPNEDLPKYEVGDLVRVPKEKTKFSKEIIGNWTIELFRISKVLDTDPITYQIQDLNKKEIKGAYYESELQKVPESVLEGPHRIEKILERRTVGRGRNARKEMLVKWLGYPEEFNSWVQDV